MRKWHPQEISQLAVGEPDPPSLHLQHISSTPGPEGHSMNLWVAKLVYFEFAVSKMKQKLLVFMWELKCKPVKYGRGESDWLVSLCI